jgi:hypothetical protein
MGRFRGAFRFRKSEVESDEHCTASRASRPKQAKQPAQAICTRQRSILLLHLHQHIPDEASHSLAYTSITSTTPPPLFNCQVARPHSTPSRFPGCDDGLPAWQRRDRAVEALQLVTNTSALLARCCCRYGQRPTSRPVPRRSRQRLHTAVIRPPGLFLRSCRTHRLLISISCLHH